jgi:hypothetical protein
MSWLLDFLPWWTWYAAVGITLCLTVPWWWPFATWAWSIMPNWLRGALGGAVAIMAAYLAGRNRGTSNERARQQARDAKATKTRLETNDAVDKLSDPDRKRALDRWMRD